MTRPDRGLKKTVNQMHPGQSNVSSESYFCFPHLLTYLILVCLMLAGQVLAIKTDVVELKNGDKITCEVKNLSNGKLQVSTDDMGKLSIEWDKVQSVRSAAKFEVELQFGSLYFGSLGLSEDPRKVKVTGDSLTYDLFKAFIVRITPIKNTFIDRIDGAVNFGIDYTKASEVLRVNFNGRAHYRTRNRELSFDFTSVTTNQKDKDDTKRIDANLNFTRYLQDRWGWGIVSSAQHNTELGIDLRLSVGGGIGRTFLQNNQFRLRSTLALSVTNEWSNGATESRMNLELPLSGNFAMWVYDNPKTDISSKITLFPSLTDIGRYRLELDSKINRELFEDFILTFNIWLSYDNKPPTETEVKTDYGIVLGFGYTF